jgi:hypothetical protein
VQLNLRLNLMNFFKMSEAYRSLLLDEKTMNQVDEISMINNIKRSGFVDICWKRNVRRDFMLSELIT